MPITYSIPEILLKIKETANTKEEIIRALRNNGGTGLRTILRYALDGIPWYRTTLPPFTADNGPEGLAPTSIYAEVKRFYIFKEPYQLPTRRKDELLIQILEAVNSKESVMMKHMIEGTFTETYGITRELAEQAFPGLYSNQPINA